jgi:hypothetical protein
MPPGHTFPRRGSPVRIRFPAPLLAAGTPGLSRAGFRPFLVGSARSVAGRGWADSSPRRSHLLTVFIPLGPRPRDVEQGRPRVLRLEREGPLADGGGGLTAAARDPSSSCRSLRSGLSQFLPSPPRIVPRARKSARGLSPREGSSSAAGPSSAGRGGGTRGRKSPARSGGTGRAGRAPSRATGKPGPARRARRGPRRR